MTSFPEPPHAYQAPPPYQPQPRSTGKAMWIVLGVVLVLTIGGAAVCCGGVTLLGRWGLDMVGEDIAGQLRDDPIIQEEIGEIEEINVDLIASGVHTDQETFVYDVDGTKGSGQLTVKSVTTDDGGEQIIGASLRTADGRQRQLRP